MPGASKIEARIITKMSLLLLAGLSRLTHAEPSPPRKEEPEPAIIDRPIRYDEERISLTLEYIRKHYELQVKDVRIVPRAIVIHWTGTGSLQGSWRGFNRVRVRTSRRYLVRGGALNVSAHFLVGQDGTILRLVPETHMARHCIGLNYDAIGIENVGGPLLPLTDRQLQANVALVRHLTRRHPIRYLLGHREWRQLEHLPIFREKDPTYRNAKDDPDARFMRRLRQRIRDLGLLGPDGRRDDGSRTRTR